MRALLLAFLLIPSMAMAKPSGPDAFAGDRYVRVAQSAQDVTRAIRCPPPACQRARAGRTKAGSRVKPRQKGAPVPRPRPGTVAPLTQAEAVEPLSVSGGVWREVGRAVSTVIGGRPAGCPYRFCGCALAIKLFGRIVPHLNLAANWLRFPRTAPAPGMVAARRGHVFKLLAHVGGSRWQVWDANSGRGRIRIHNRSIAGYVIVNPRAG